MRYISLLTPLAILERYGAALGPVRQLRGPGPGERVQDAVGHVGRGRPVEDEHVARFELELGARLAVRGAPRGLSRVELVQRAVLGLVVPSGSGVFRAP